MKPEAITELRKPLNRAHVARRQKGGQSLSYIEGWHAIAEANRIFGFDGWTRELVDLAENTAPTKNDKGNHIVSFRARVRVTVGEVVREGTGFGSGIARDIHDAYESAVKEAETDAMKRALMTFGNPFGLALYDKTQANVADEVDESKVLYLKECEDRIKSFANEQALREWWGSEEQKDARRDFGLSKDELDSFMNLIKFRIENMRKDAA